MTTLYRKVLCSERLPEPLIEVDSDKGKWVYYPDDPYVNFFPSYWLEPIDLPTDEEIEKLAKRQMRLKHIMALDERSISDCIDGIKMAVELLTKGGK